MDFLNNKIDYVFRSTVGKKRGAPKALHWESIIDFS